MSNRSRIVLGSLGGAFVIHLVALACSGNHSVASDRDATVADAMQDAMAHLIDGEIRDDHAGGTAIEVACDQENTTTSTLLTDGGAYTYTSENTYFFGIVPGVTVDPRTAPRVFAYVCDPESFGPSNPC